MPLNEAMTGYWRLGDDHWSGKAAQAQALSREWKRQKRCWRKLFSNSVPPFPTAQDKVRI
uniref:Uncharacterized protein n=1 Tax=Manihot esculenta TaxID=3983 RepID=A0A2C9W6G3_MANES